jgi:hypothetical protein
MNLQFSSWQPSKSNGVEVAESKFVLKIDFKEQRLKPFQTKFLTPLKTCVDLNGGLSVTKVSDLDLLDSG